MGTILIVDDHQNTTDAIQQIAEEKNHQGLVAHDAENAFEMFKQSSVDLVITDMKLPGKSGLELLKQIRHIDSEIPVIVITAFGTVQNAVQAMKLGAFDYISKPFSVEEIELKIEKALMAHNMTVENRELHWENEYLREEMQYNFPSIVGQSAKMKEVYQLVEKVASASSSVLILGESGTGKELIAKAVHFSSPRKNKPFIKVNCAALAEGVLESELFGHEKGAFTGAIRHKPGRFEIAGEGTIFLDEIGEIGLSTQVKLLRVLQEKEFERVGGIDPITMKARIITATNQNLEDLIRQKKFREDLFYRLNVVTIQLPSLRERNEDIPLLAQHFVQKYRQETGKSVQGITPRAMKCLLNYSYPGNIRELENVIERAIVLTNNPFIDLEDFPQNMIEWANHSDPAETTSNVTKDDLLTKTENFEKNLIEEALMKTRGNMSQAAQELGINRTTLRYKMVKYHLLNGEFQS